MEATKMTNRFITFSLAAAVMALAACASPADPAGPSDPAPLDPQSIADRQWVLESFKLNGQSMALHPKISQTLEFDASGKAGGNGGCNNYFADYTLSGANGIAFGAIGATKMACSEGMTEEAQFLQGLASAQQVSRLSEAELELQSADGQTVLTFANRPQASGPDALAGKVWVLTRLYSRTDGTQIEPIGDNAPTIQFKDDGSLAGRGGCNQFFGAYELGDGNALKVKDLGATLMACVDPQVMTLESAYFEALNKVGAFTQAGNELQLSSDDGSLLLTFSLQTP